MRPKIAEEKPRFLLPIHIPVALCRFGSADDQLGASSPRVIRAILPLRTVKPHGSRIARLIRWNSASGVRTRKLAQAVVGGTERPAAGAGSKCQLQRLRGQLVPRIPELMSADIKTIRMGRPKYRLHMPSYSCLCKVSSAERATSAHPTQQVSSSPTWAADTETEQTTFQLSSASHHHHVAFLSILESLASSSLVPSHGPPARPSNTTFSV